MGGYGNLYVSRTVEDERVTFQAITEGDRYLMSLDVLRDAELVVIRGERVTIAGTDFVITGWDANERALILVRGDWDGSLRPVDTYMHDGVEYGTYELRAKP